MMHDHQVLIPAAFVSRPNRFVTKAVMGMLLLLVICPTRVACGSSFMRGRGFTFEKPRIQRVKRPMMLSGLSVTVSLILLDTQYNNDVAEYLIRNHLIPGWESCRVVKREVTVGTAASTCFLSRRGSHFM